MRKAVFQQGLDQRPLERLSGPQRAAVAEGLLPSWRTWCAQWGMTDPLVRVEPLVQGAVRERSTDAWTVLGRLGASPVREAGRTSLICAAMEVGAGATWSDRSMAAAFANAVAASLELWRSGWLGDLSASGTGALSQADASLAELGVLVIAFGCRQSGGDGAGEVREYRLQLDAAALPRVLVPPAGRHRPGAVPLVSLLSAIARQPVRLRVGLGQASLHLGQLPDLQPGDVIPLNYSLARPAEILLDLEVASRLPVVGCLGQRDGRWAICLDPKLPTDEHAVA